MKSMNGTTVFKEVMRARREHAALGVTRAFMSGQSYIESCGGESMHLDLEEEQCGTTRLVSSQGNFMNVERQFWVQACSVISLVSVQL